MSQNSNPIHKTKKSIQSVIYSNIDDLEQSISKLGLLEGLVIDEDNQVISGNRRFVAVKNLGWKKVECQKVSIPKDEILTYIIHHNKQRVKTCRERLNEAKVLMQLNSIGQGKRNDLTSVNANRGSTTRDEVGKIIGMSGVQITKLLLIDRENSTKIPLEIIEVQTGDYLGEDDIVRLKDKYGRK